MRSKERITIEDYQPYFDEFNPTAYDPKAWAKAAKKAGMKYAVMTAKHHDGFCLFDSKLTDYKCTNTKAGRDLIREYVDAFRAEGIKVGLYYSIIDWHHEDYPKYKDRQHPMRDNEAYKDEKINFSNYLEYMHGQVRELLTNYGKIDLIWFDFSYEDMTGEKWEATKLVTMMRELQPDIIIDNRLGGNVQSANPEIYSGDFASPEQVIPPAGILDEKGNSVPWEACITMNDHWGYCNFDDNFKSPKTIIRMLVECVSKNGNLLLNVGPDAKGRIPDESLAILDVIGKWMERNNESIYGCGISEFPKPEWGRFTQNGKKLYAHIFDRSIGVISFEKLKGKFIKARYLRDGSEVVMDSPWPHPEYPEDSFLDFQDTKLRDEIDTVVEFTLK